MTKTNDKCIIFDFDSTLAAINVSNIIEFDDEWQRLFIGPLMPYFPKGCDVSLKDFDRIRQNFKGLLKIEPEQIINKMEKDDFDKFITNGVENVHNYQIFLDILFGGQTRLKQLRQL